MVCDDTFGPLVAKEIENDPSFEGKADVFFASLAGFALLDLLQNRKNVLVVDTIITGEMEPGTLKDYPGGISIPTLHLVGSHQLSLPAALEFGKKMGYNLPERIDILACEAQDIETLVEEPTPAVKAAIPKAVKRVREWIDQLE